MLAKSFLHNAVLFHLGYGIAKRIRQSGYVAFLQSFLIKLVNILFYRGRRANLPFHAIKPCSEHDSESKIWVIAWIRASEFASRRIFPARREFWDPDKRRPVRFRPADIDRSLVARDEPFVRVDGWGDHCRESLDM